MPIEESIPTVRPTYRPEIDGLRALAVVAVIINHFNWEILPSGFLGVDIFFVISGFVVTSSLYGKPDQSWQSYLTNFYARRFKRLLPALITCVVVTALVSCFFIYDASTALETGMASLVGLSNVSLLRENTNYFGAAAELNPFTHTWSLGVEEQFYLVFPVILGLCGYSRNRRKGGVRTLFLIVLLLSTLSFLSYLQLAVGQPRPPSFLNAFFLMPFRFWELGAGCLCFIALSKGARGWPNRVGPLSPVLAPLCAGLMVAVLFASADTQPFSNVAVAALTSLLLLSFAGSRPLLQIFSAQGLVYLGKLSYSLYLWHWSVLVISRWTIGVSKWTILPQLGLIVGLAIASYRWIETPLRQAQWAVIKSKTVGYGLSAVLLSFVFLFGLGQASPNLLYLGNASLYTDSHYRHPVSFPHRAYAPVIPGTSISRKGCLFRFGRGASMSITPADVDTCRVEKNPSYQTIYVYGDSYAGHLSPLISKVYHDFPINLEYFTKGGCPFPSRKIDPAGDCYQFSLAREKRLLSSVKAGDLVILSRQITYKFGTDFVRQLEEITLKLSEKGASVIFQKPLPTFAPNNQTVCMEPVQWFRKFQASQCMKIESYPLDKHLTYMAEVDTQLRQIRVNSGLYLWDPLPAVCPDGSCSTHRNGIRLYRDQGHLSTKGAEYLYESFTQFLDERSLLRTETS